MVLLTSPCLAPPDSGLAGIPARSDAARVGDLNQVFRTYAKDHPTWVSLVDLHSFLCPHGQFAATVRGVAARDPDGTHLSPAGAKVVWLAVGAAHGRGLAPEPMTGSSTASNGP